MRLLLLPLIGPVMLAIVALVYAAPFVFSIADALGRPPSEWKTARRRTAWIAALCLSVPAAITMGGQLVALAYAVRVPRSVSSDVAVAGASATRRRALLAFMASLLVFGPLWVAMGWNNSDDALLSGLAVSTTIVVVCVLAAYHRVSPHPRLRAASVAVVVVIAGCAGWVNREAWLNSCYRRCASLPRDTVWVVPAFSIAGPGIAWFATRSPKPA